MSIKLNNISKKFEKKAIIENLTLTLEDKKTACFFGPSGCGKTTLLNIISGLLKAESGSIEGVDFKKISMVFQEDRLLPWFNVEKNILYANPKADVDLLLGELALGDIKNMMPDEISGGMKRRVALARALAKNADIYAFDEVVKGLDFTTKKQIIEVINQYTNGKTVLLITHDIEEAVLLSDKIYCFSSSPLKIEKEIEIKEEKNNRNEATIEKYKKEITTN
ncbi:MAG: ATP-binding cassette domain-containing protein [Clostridiales bacterium]|nr:ATP-binding cassette domain-containing protein [Clostridiales bacterium]